MDIFSYILAEILISKKFKSRQRRKESLIVDFFRKIDYGQVKSRDEGE